MPILHTHPVPEMTYIVQNSEASTLIVHTSLEEKGRELAEKAGWVYYNCLLSLSNHINFTTKLTTFHPFASIPTISASRMS